MSTAANTPAKAPKTMSSKLLTMKFMQRAAASSPIPTPDQPSPKRHKSTHTSESSFNVDALADQEAVRAALATEEAKRQAALEKQAADAGDTRWVLNFKEDLKSSSTWIKQPSRIVEAGFASIDHGLDGINSSKYNENSDLEAPLIIGRRSYGKFNRAIEKLQDPKADDSSESESDEEGDQSEDDSADSYNDDHNGTDALIKSTRKEYARKIKAERKAKRKTEKAELVRLAEKRKKKEIKLNKLTSISGGNSQPLQTCFGCGKAGHINANCPQRSRHHHGDEEDRPRKSRKSA